MANEEHLAILRQGVAAWNAWRKEHQGVRPDFRLADLRQGDFRQADLIGADLVEADLVGADLGEARLIRAYLVGAKLVGANLREANLREANLRGADLYEAKAFKADLSEADLSVADLRRANLSETDLRDTNFSGAHLRRANLSGADLRRANLSGANLSGVDLSEADLSGIDLSGINLRGANLSEANLSEANLSETNLSGSILYRTLFGTVDLSTVTGLDTVEHRGPSMIGIDTLYLSHGKIPEAFLRGCGIPNAVIENLPLLLSATQAADMPPAPEPVQTVTPRASGQPGASPDDSIIDAPASETFILSQEDIVQQQTLLTAHRRRLANQLHRLALLGDAHAPPDLTLDIADARGKIARVKKILREHGAKAPDHPDDTADESL